MTKPPISDKIPGLRQRQRAGGGWRVWWEPNRSARALGFEPRELAAEKPTWSKREAKRLNDAVEAARNGKPRTPTGGRTISALIHAYRRDPAFTEKAEATRRSYAGLLRLIEEKWGPRPVADFTKPVMREWYMALRDQRGQTQAVRLVRMMSILFSLAEWKGWRPENSNPCYRLQLSGSARRDRVATWAELDAILDAASETGLPSIGTATLLSALQGQRQTDARRATVGAFRQTTVLDSDPATGQSAQITVWVWKVRRSKRGNLGAMRLHPLVLDRVLPLLEDRPADAPLLLDERTGQPYGQDLFERRWKEVRAAAARHCPSVADLQFRDLRRTFGVWARTGGASDADVEDVLGNTAASDAALAEIYMPPSLDTASRAVMSIRRPADDKRRQA